MYSYSEFGLRNETLIHIAAVQIAMPILKLGVTFNLTLTVLELHCLHFHSRVHSLSLIFLVHHEKNDIARRYEYKLDCQLPQKTYPQCKLEDNQTSNSDESCGDRLCGIVSNDIDDAVHGEK